MSGMRERIRPWLALTKMRWLVLTFTLSGVLSLLSVAVWREWRYAKAITTYPDGQVFDFGSIPEGATLRHTFRIVNVGSRPLNIRKVLPGCGCTQAAVTINRISPGTTGELKITYRSRSVSHREAIPVVIETDDPQEPAIEFVVTGYVRLAVFWYPRSISFYSAMTSTRPAALTQDVNLKSADDMIEITDLRTSSDVIAAGVVQNGHDRVLRITLRPSCPRGGRTEYVMATCRMGTITKQVLIPVYINLRS